MTAPLRMGAVVAALVIAAFAAGIAQADPNSPKIGFFGCAAGGSFAKSVPANTPLYIQSGFSSGTRGLVEATFSVSYSAGGGTTFTPPFREILPNAGGTWTALFRVDLPALASGDSMTIQWTSTYTHPTQDLVPPSSDWDPVANFQPPWDGTGLKYKAFIAAGVYDVGTCTGPSFTSAGCNYNPGNVAHGVHSGDLPQLLVQSLVEELLILRNTLSALPWDFGNGGVASDG